MTSLFRFEHTNTLGDQQLDVGVMVCLYGIVPIDEAFALVKALRRRGRSDGVLVNSIAVTSLNLPPCNQPIHLCVSSSHYNHAVPI